MFHPFLATMVLGRPKDISNAHPISLFSLIKGMKTLNGGMGQLTEKLFDKTRESIKLSTRVKKVILEENKQVLRETGHDICYSGMGEHQIKNLIKEERRRLVINEAKRFFPDFPDEPAITK